MSPFLIFRGAKRLIGAWATERAILEQALGLKQKDDEKSAEG